MTTIDLIIIFAYLTAILIFAIYISRGISTNGFFVNNRNTGTFFSTASIVSTNVGAGTYVGVASAGLESGISYAFMGMLVSFCGFAMLAYFAPRISKFGRENDATTIGDFLTVHYGKKVGMIGSICTICVYIFFLAGQFLALAIMIQLISGVGFYSALGFSVISLLALSVISGVRSDIYTDGVHFVFMSVILLFVLFPLILSSSGGLNEILLKIPESFTDVTAFGGTSFVVLAVVFGAPTLLVAMEMWQRVYSAASPQVARRSLIYAAIVNIPLLSIPAIIGLYVKSNPELVTVTNDQAFFIAMIDVLPQGLLGLGLASALAAFLSTANTMIMVISTSIYKDLYKNVISGKNSGASDLMTARIVTAAVGVCGLLFAYLIPSIVQLSLNAFFSLMVLAPAVLGVFFWKRRSVSAAFWSILSGAVLTWILLPFAPKMAFLPAVVLSIIVYISGSYLFKRNSANDHQTSGQG